MKVLVSEDFAALGLKILSVFAPEYDFIEGHVSPQ